MTDTNEDWEGVAADQALTIALLKTQVAELEALVREAQCDNVLLFRAGECSEPNLNWHDRAAAALGDNDGQ